MRWGWRERRGGGKRRRRGKRWGRRDCRRACECWRWGKGGCRRRRRGKRRRDCRRACECRRRGWREGWRSRRGKRRRTRKCRRWDKRRCRRWRTRGRRGWARRGPRRRRGFRDDFRFRRGRRRGFGSVRTCQSKHGERGSYDRQRRGFEQSGYPLAPMINHSAPRNKPILLYLAMQLPRVSPERGIRISATLGNVAICGSASSASRGAEPVSTATKGIPARSAACASTTLSPT